MRMVVDLPEPLGPRKPVTTPGWTSKLRSRTATVSPKRLVSEIAAIIDLHPKDRGPGWEYRLPAFRGWG